MHGSHSTRAVSSRISHLTVTLDTGFVPAYKSHVCARRAHGLVISSKTVSMRRGQPPPLRLFAGDASARHRRSDDACRRGAHVHGHAPTDGRVQPPGRSRVQPCARMPRRPSTLSAARVRITYCAGRLHDSLTPVCPGAACIRDEPPMATMGIQPTPYVSTYPHHPPLLPSACGAHAPAGRTAAATSRRSVYAATLAFAV